MERLQLVGVFLILISTPLLAVPATMTVDSYQYHDTSATHSKLNQSTTLSESNLEANVTNVIAYENMSDRGKELYRQSLKEGGRVTFPVGEGAPKFTYLTESEVAEMELAEAYRAGSIIVERPNDTDLPAPGEARNDSRYDLMFYGQQKPDFPSEEYVPQIVLPGLGIVSLIVGLYLFIRTR